MVKLKIRRIGIIAGTEIDVRFGVRFFSSKCVEAVGYAISRTPQEQTLLQALGREKLTRKTIEAIRHLDKHCIDAAVIYCNSLSGAVDINAIREEFHFPVITPLEVYEKLAYIYDRFGIIAANCQSLANIERTMLKNNKRAIVLGLADLRIVEDIEKGLSAEAIISKHLFYEIYSIMKQKGAEIFMLGCTHFVYLNDVLKGDPGLEIIEPSEGIWEILTKGQL